MVLLAVTSFLAAGCSYTCHSYQPFTAVAADTTFWYTGDVELAGLEVVTDTQVGSRRRGRDVNEQVADRLVVLGVHTFAATASS